MYHTTQRGIYVFFIFHLKASLETNKPLDNYNLNHVVVFIRPTCSSNVHQFQDLWTEIHSLICPDRLGSGGFELSSPGLVGIQTKLQNEDFRLIDSEVKYYFISTSEVLFNNNFTLFLNSVLAIVDD